MSTKPVAAASDKPSCYIDLDHGEQLIQVASELTIGPFRNALYYLFPFSASYSIHATQIRSEDSAQQTMYPEASKKRLLDEVENLTCIAQIGRKVTAYGCLSHSFQSSGGLFSITPPAVFLPYQHIFRPNKSSFTEERAEENLTKDIWRFTDDETRFLIARELGHIKENGGLIRIAVKVALLAAVFLFYSSPISGPIALLIAIAAVATYIFSQKAGQKKTDLAGVLILSSRLGNFTKAKGAALSALEKMRQQNLFRRESNWISRIYITKQGNNALDFNHPFLTTRIERIQRMHS